MDSRVVPTSESLKDTLARVIPYWDDAIAPELLKGKTVLVSAHGNSLRALIKHIEGVSDEDIVGYEIKTGSPLIYELDDNLNFVSKKYL